jgi:hypothetical protein
MRTETVVLDEDRGAGMRAAIEENPKMVGLLGAINGRRIVGIVVEAPDAAAGQAEPEKPARGRK